MGRNPSTPPREITMDRDYFEHLLNCLANQKYVHQINADATECDYKTIQKKNQKVIDKAWRDGMDKLTTK